MGDLALKQKKRVLEIRDIPLFPLPVLPPEDFLPRTDFHCEEMIVEDGLKRFTDVPKDGSDTQLEKVAEAGGKKKVKKIGHRTVKASVASPEPSQTAKQ